MKSPAPIRMPHDQHKEDLPHTAEKDKIPVHEKTLYGFGSPALDTTTYVIDNQIQQVLVYGMGMSPIMKSMIVLIFRLWDAFIDPLMGWVSDNTRTRFGRRRPFMFVGTIGIAVLLPIVWRFNENWSLMSIAVWFVIFGILVSTATTIYNIPYQTLKLEMTPDYDERTSINVYASIFVRAFGLVAPWIWAMTQLPFFTGQAPGEEANTLLGIRNIAIWFAGLAIVMGMIPTFVCKERYYHLASNQKKEPFWKSFKLTFQSRSFRLMLMLILFMNIEGLVLGMGGYIGLYYVMGGDKGLAAVIVGATGTTGSILGLLSLPIFGWLSHRLGKERSLFLVIATNMMMAASILFLYNPDYPWLMLIPGALYGPLSAGLWTIVPSMKADIVDEDEVRSGERREGSFESVFSWFQKMAGTIFMSFSGFVVVFLGFEIEQGANQDPGVFQRMIWAMALVPVFISIIKLWIIKKWPLTREVMADVRTRLEARRGEING